MQAIEVGGNDIDAKCSGSSTNLHAVSSYHLEHIRILIIRCRLGVRTSVYSQAPVTDLIYRYWYVDQEC